MSSMNEMGRLNFAQEGPTCVWRLDFKPALTCIRLSNIEFSSRGAVGFFSLFFEAASNRVSRVVTVSQDFDGNGINQRQMKVIIAIMHYELLLPIQFIT